MKIHCISITKYKNCPITILHFENVFLYMFVRKGKFYQNHCTVSVNPYNWLRWKFGQWEYPYSKEEMVKIKETVMGGAIKTIDELNK